MQILLGRRAGISTTRAEKLEIQHKKVLKILLRKPRMLPSSTLFMPLLTLPLCLRDVIHILSPLSILSNSICVHLTSTVSTGFLPVARETPFPFRNPSPPFYFTLPFSLRTLPGWHFPKKLRTFLPSAFLRALSRLDFDFVFLILLQSLLIHAGSFFSSPPLLPSLPWLANTLSLCIGRCSHCAMRCCNK